MSGQIVYGTSPARTYWRKSYRVWGWYGWVRWPLSSDGLHIPGHRWPFRWMAELDAKRIARNCGGGVPASLSQIVAQDVAGSDPKPWFR